MPARRLTVASAAVALALAGCSGESPSDPTTSAEGSTAGSTSGATSSTSSPASPSSKATFPSPTDTGTPFDQAEFVDRLETALEDHPTGEVEAKVTIDGEVVTEAKGVQDLENDLVDMTINLADTNFAYRYVDGKAYLAQPPKWLELKKGGVDDSTLEMLSQVHAKPRLEAFLAGLTAVTTKGQEDLDGETTTHYVAKVDSNKALEALGQDASGESQTLLYDIWLGDDDLIRKLSFTQGNGLAEMRIGKWGEPVSIVAPKKSEIVTSP